MRVQRPTMSLIVPAYNATGHIGSLLDSLALQTIADYDVIVVDDGSTDDLLSVLQQHELNVRTYRQENQGPSAARNRGARAAEGEYLAFLDSDDVISPSWVENFVEMSGTDAATLHCGMRVVSLHQSGREQYLRPHTMSGAFYNMLGLFLPGAYAVRRDLFWDVDGFNPSLRYGEHTELALRLAARLVGCSNRSITVEETLVTKFHDRGREKRASYHPAKLEGAEYVLEHHREQLSRDPDLLANYHGVAAVSSLGIGDRHQARKHFRAAARVGSGRPIHLLRAAVSALPIVGTLYWRRRLGQAPSPSDPDVV